MADATPASAQPRTIRVWADTIVKDTCRGPHCGVAIEFAVTVKNGKRMPFVGEIVALVTEVDRATGRQIFHVDLATNHFADCPDSPRFSGSSRR